jgi:integrase
MQLRLIDKPPVKGQTPYYQELMSRHGRLMCYVRVTGFERERLDAEPGTSAMTRAYNAAIRKIDALKADRAAGKKAAPKPREMVVCKPSTRPEYIERFGDTTDPGEAGALRWVWAHLEVSNYLNSLSPETQRYYRKAWRTACAFIDADGTALGDQQVLDLDKEHIKAVRDTMRDTPAAADDFVKAMKAGFNWAREKKLFKGDNPAVGIKKLVCETDDDFFGHLQWEQEHIDKFVTYWPLGSQPLMTFGLCYYGGVRISDAAAIGPFQIRQSGSKMEWREVKGGSSKAVSDHAPKPKRGSVDVHPELARIIRATPNNGRTFVGWRPSNDKGNDPGNLRSYKRQSLSKAFSQWCLDAGLPPDYTAHGVRKASAQWMFDANGGDVTVLYDVFNWKPGSPMALHYVKQRQKKMSQARGISSLPALNLPTRRAA